MKLTKGYDGIYYFWALNFKDGEGVIITVWPPLLIDECEKVTRRKIAAKIREYRFARLRYAERRNGDL